MKIAVVGAKERDTEEDRLLVHELVDRIHAEAPYTIFVGMLTHIGVGKFLKDKTMQKDARGSYVYAAVECTVRTFAKGLSKSDLGQIYLGRNATPFEISDMLIYLASEDRRGTCEDLLARFEASGRPVLVMMPGDPLPDKILEALECRTTR